MDTPTPTRRALLGSAAALATAVAGCLQEENDADTANPDSSTPAATATEPISDLDLREANVTDVALESRDADEYRFSVELFHDDDGEDGYANWWQVETLDGDKLGRRDLTHPHSTDPFTRSATIVVPDDVDCVVVRGHDQTHGYGGQAMTVSVPDGATNAVRQGTDRQALDAGDCP